MKLGIIGTGLIGGSIGMRGRANGWHAIGYDVEQRVAEEAQACGAIDRAVSLEDVLADSEIVAIAAHTRATITLLDHLRAAPPRTARLIVDVSSVKAPIVHAARGVANFVATHPMAGRECSGPGNASADLFEGKSWFYVPTGDRELDWRAVEFVGSLGGVPVEADAAEHDRVVALTSHLPQVIATLFGSTVPSTVSQAYLGPAARELLRLSRSNMEMWSEVLRANRTNVCTALRGFAADLLDLADVYASAEALYYDDEHAWAAKSTAASTRSE